MFPLLKDGELALTKLLKITEIKRGEIILFRYQNKLFIKRIIGFPGEKVSIKKNQLFIDDLLIEKNYISQLLNYKQNYEWNSDPDSFVVLGDNSTDSLDSRKLGRIYLKREETVYLYKRKIWPIC